jgi:putative ABC transport system permease protein
MTSIAQILAVLGMNIASIPRRWGGALVAFIGVASAVAVLVAIMAMAAGTRSLGQFGISESRVIVLSTGAAAEYMGSFTPDQVAAISEAPGVARDNSGAVTVLPMTVANVEGTKKSDGTSIDIVARGIAPQRWPMMGDTRFIEGRMYRSGVQELVVGAAVRDRFKGFEVGNRVRLQGGDWTVVGVISDGGGIGDSTVYADDISLQSALNRHTYQSILVELRDPGQFPAFRDGIASDRRVGGKAVLYREFVRSQVGQLTNLLQFLGLFLGLVMGVGAGFTAVNALVSMIDARRREIATLRAIGFHSGPIFLATLAEAVAICVPAGLAGAAIATVAIHGQTASSYDFTFKMLITPGLVLLAVAWATIVGVIGGLAPAWTASRIPVTTALRAL